jgi:hypothetical protein
VAVSRGFWRAIALVCAVFGLYEAGLNLHLRSLNDTALAACYSPASVRRTDDYTAAL